MKRIITAAALAAALGIAGCGSATQTTTQTTATTTARGASPSGTSTTATRPSSPKPPSGPYGEAAAEVFRTQCEVSGEGVQSQGKCQCELSYIEAHVPWAQYVAEGASIGIATSAPTPGTPGAAAGWLLDTGPNANNPQWYLDAVAACPQP